MANKRNYLARTWARKAARKEMIWKDAKIATDNFGATYRITSRRRILAVWNSMRGKWVAECRCRYLSGAFQEASKELYQ